jgi:hypothetical protein
MRPEKEAYLGVYNALKVVHELLYRKSPAWNHDWTFFIQITLCTSALLPLKKRPYLAKIFSLF